MPYFAEHYSDLSYPLEAQNTPGFRDAQRGALFAIASHFTSRSDPAIVSMPTGSGKTAVLQATALLLRAERVLVLTPSRLVREQIADDFRSLGVLRRLGAVPDGIQPPNVMATGSRVTDENAWQAMRDFDVVVATVPSVSPHLEDVPVPPLDLFDLILVDEAHHSPAVTWSATLARFPDAKKVLFTATPFRRDNREIHGRFVYTYDLKRAYEDGVFGHIDYRQVDDIPGVDDDHRREDVAIALAAEETLGADRKAGFDHLIMVRTDSRARASDLAKAYADNTALRLKLIHGNHSLVHVKKVLAALAANELDGIICVNMLGEGFDLPRLKVAAVHSPHRSLAVTLQFIGRFARTAGANLGSATFVATRSAVKVEAERLYSAGAVWSEIIPNLSEARVQREVDARELYESFQLEAATIPDLSDLSLYSLSPYAHVKIFRLREDIAITKQPHFGFDREQVFGRVSEEANSSVYITRMASKVPWSTHESLTDIRFDLFIFYYDKISSLLFVCASKRSDGLYRRIVRDLVGYDPRILGLSALNRALKELEQARFFNVGMRNRQQSSLTESYRMMSGSRVDEAIREEDARLYHRGHCFGSAVEGGVDVTIGLSSASKIWSNTNLALKELLDWCRNLARKIHDKKAAVTGSKLDLLQMGEIVTRIPAKVLWVEWDKDIYISPPIAKFQLDGREREASLSDFNLIVEDSDDVSVGIVLQGNGFESKLRYRINEDPFFSYASEKESGVSLSHGRSTEDLIDYLNDNPLNLMLDDWSRLSGEEHFSAPPGEFEPYDAELIETIDWAAEKVDVTIEYKAGGDGNPSIQHYLTRALDVPSNDVVYWDHGSGEAADFVVMRRVQGGGVEVELYHCKGAGGSAPGNRVDDVYEVSAQAVKSQIWCDLPRLADRLTGRFARKTGMAAFIRGDTASMAQISSLRPVRFQMVVVQPGVTKGNLEQKIAEVLAAANSHLIRAGHRSMKVWGSA